MISPGTQMQTAGLHSQLVGKALLRAFCRQEGGQSGRSCSQVPWPYGSSEREEWAVVTRLIPISRR